MQPVGRDGRADPVVLDLARSSDLLLAVKPVENSFGLGRLLSSATGTPLLLDVDDPDIEVRTTWRPWHERLPRRVLQPRYRRLTALKRHALRTPTLVSNPELRRVYGGVVVPHVRPSSPPPGRAPSPGGTTVRFVGSPRGHKGVEQLRAAVARLAGDGFRLEVTAPAPADARPWEGWLGTTTLEEGRELVRTADVVAVPSLAGGWSPAQLPAKLVDAMMAGVPVVASDVGPIAWALGDGGVLVPPGDVDALAAGLASLADPAVRERLGRAGRARAVETFSVEAVAPAFEAQVRAVVGGRPAPDGAQRTVVAVLTYRRVDELLGLLPELVRQTGRLDPPARVLVVDNDPDRQRRRRRGRRAGPGAVRARAGAGHRRRPQPGARRGRRRTGPGLHRRRRAAGEGWLAHLLGDAGGAPARAAVAGPVLIGVRGRARPVGPGRRLLLPAQHADRHPGPRRGDRQPAARPGRGARVRRPLRRPRWAWAAAWTRCSPASWSGRGGRMVWCDEAAAVDQVPAGRATRLGAATGAARRQLVEPHLPGPGRGPARPGPAAGRPGRRGRRDAWAWGPPARRGARCAAPTPTRPAGSASWPAAAGCSPARSATRTRSTDVRRPAARAPGRRRRP